MQGNGNEQDKEKTHVLILGLVFPDHVTLSKLPFYASVYHLQKEYPVLCLGIDGRINWM